MQLYTYFRSGAAYRVRIALALKGLAYDSIPVNLIHDGGEQHCPGYRQVNPQARVPCLRVDNGQVLIQSPAIIEYLEELVPDPPFLPRDKLLRARVRGVAAIIGCDAHPLNNVAVLNALRDDFGADSAQLKAWAQNWLSLSFNAIEALIGDEGFCFGAAPGLADIYLVPQLASARRFGLATEGWRRVSRAGALAEAHPAFIAAAPANQPDAA